MNLLLVDDEQYVIDDLLSGISWNQIGIDEVFTAMNIRQAKEVLEHYDIQILLCDIEMPQGSGLDLLRWIVEKQFLCEKILITCHVEFNYAREAMRLGATEYLLKPVDYKELECSVCEAIIRINTALEQTQAVKQLQNMKGNQPLITERFWSDILNHTLCGEMAIMKSAQMRNIQLPSPIFIQPVLTKIQQNIPNGSRQDLELLKFSMKNMADDIFAPKEDAGITFFSKNLFHIILLYYREIPDSDENAGLVNRTTYFINLCKRFAGYRFSSYIGKPVLPDQLADEYDLLVTDAERNVAYSDLVFTPDVRPNITTTINEKWIVELSSLVNEIRADQLVSRARSYLETLANTTGIDSHILHCFQQDFTQMMYEKASHNGILPHHLLADAESIHLSMQASQSIESTLQWIAHISHKILNYTQELQQTQSIVHSSIQYIKEHLKEDISRKEVAAQAYLNPDYLDRIFKKETGMSISKYITQEKVNWAKFLLTTTNISITDIASQVGFSNMSNFASMFKRITDMNPNEYRKQTSAHKDSKSCNL